MLLVFVSHGACGLIDTSVTNWSSPLMQAALKCGPTWCQTSDDWWMRMWVPASVTERMSASVR